MDAQFTEFSFGFALTMEIVNRLRSAYKHFSMFAPEFPSLKDEGSGKGYDVQIGTLSRPVFIQFKLSEYLVRSTARGIKDGTFGGPYYRFHLRANPSNQHADLLKLEKSGEDVYYAAPFFHQQWEFNSHFSSNTVFANTQKLHLHRG